MKNFEFEKKSNNLQKFDFNGNLIEETILDSEGNKKFIYQYNYDDYNNIIEKRGYDSENTLIGKYKYKYSNDGNLQEEIFYNKELLSRTTIYNTKGHKQQINYYDSQVYVFKKNGTKLVFN